MFEWKDLDFWKSPEWDMIQKRLDDLDVVKVQYNPSRDKLFASLDATPFEDVRAVILGQDPYPNPKLATGVAFSIPADVKEFPPTLNNIFKEYNSDLHYDLPISGDLTKWCKSGVLLWNVIPTCRAFKPLSHATWLEWDGLTKEILERLSAKGVVVASMGRVAHNFSKYIDLTNSVLIQTSHPSPLGFNNGKSPFKGSRLFSSINAKLAEKKLLPIDWKLD